jgi:peptide subunit release factor RF-3
MAFEYEGIKINLPDTLIHQDFAEGNLLYFNPDYAID